MDTVIWVVVNMIKRLQSAWRGFNFDLPVITKEPERCHHISHILSSVDRGSLTVREGMNPADRKSYVSDSSLVFKQPPFKREKDALIEEHVYWIAENVTEENQREFHKGTINGIQLFYDQFETMHNEHMNNIKPAESFDKTNTLPEG